MALAILETKSALDRGAPLYPRPGQRWTDPKTGITFEWMQPEDVDGLGDLGFWGALLGAVSGVAGLFGGGGKKEKQQLAEAEQVIRQQDEIIRQQQAIIDKPRLGKWIKKNTGLVVFGIGALVIMFSGKR